MRSGVRPSPEEHARVRALVRRYGWNATASQVLEPGYRYFFVGDDACVAYVDTGRAWVAAGAPLAEDTRLASVASAFVETARAANRRACFFATEQRFVDRAALRALLVGEQGVWNPSQWNAVVRDRQNLREQLRRARAKGVTVQSFDRGAEISAGGPSRAAVEAVVERWRVARELAPMGFLARVDPLALTPDGRLFVAMCGGAVVGMLSAVPVHGRDGWLLQSLLRSPDAPNGTAEILVDGAMRAACDEGRTFATLGLAPLAGEVRASLRLARRAGDGFYNFTGLRSFKAKLGPESWDPVYLSYPARTGTFRALGDVLAAFAREGLFRFGLRTIARGPAILVRLLAVLLVPWTGLLAAADATRWFPSPAIKWAWVGFDVVLAFGLRALWWRWNRGLAWLLTGAIGADATLTAIEALSWNVPRTHGLGAALVLIAAVFAPLLACFLLGRLTARRGIVVTAGRRAPPAATA